MELFWCFGGFFFFFLKLFFNDVSEFPGHFSLYITHYLSRKKEGLATGKFIALNRHRSAPFFYIKGARLQFETLGSLISKQVKSNHSLPDSLSHQRAKLSKRNWLSTCPRAFRRAVWMWKFLPHLQAVKSYSARSKMRRRGRDQADNAVLSAAVGDQMTSVHASLWFGFWPRKPGTLSTEQISLYCLSLNRENIKWHFLCCLTQFSFDDSCHLPRPLPADQTKKSLMGSLEFEMLFAQAKWFQRTQKLIQSLGGGELEEICKASLNVWKILQSKSTLNLECFPIEVWTARGHAAGKAWEVGWRHWLDAVKSQDDWQFPQPGHTPSLRLPITLSPPFLFCSPSFLVKEALFSCPEACILICSLPNGIYFSELSCVLQLCGHTKPTLFPLKGAACSVYHHSLGT